MPTFFDVICNPQVEVYQVTFKKTKAVYTVFFKSYIVFTKC